MTDAGLEARDAGLTEHHEERPRTRIFTGSVFRVRDGHGWAFSDERPETPATVRREGLA